MADDLPPGFRVVQGATPQTPASGLPAGFRVVQPADVPAGYRVDPAAVAPPARRSAEEVQAEFNDAPWYQQAGQSADDIVRLIANGMTFGFADKIAGAMGDGTEAERLQTQEARDRAGLAGTVAEVGGSIATPVGMARNGATLIGRLGTDAMTGVGGLAARAGLAATEGAGYGALSAAGQDQDIEDGALLGAIMGGVASPVVEGAQAVFRGALRGSSAPAMTTEQARAAGQKAYEAADAAGVAFTPQAVDRVRNTVTSQLADFGYDPALQPGAAAVLKRLDELQGQNVTLKGLETLRKVANNGYIKGNQSNNRVVDMLVSAIDDTVANPAAGEVLMGDAKAGAAALSEARDMWRRASKGAQIQGALTDAEFQTARAGFGGNVDNPIRQRLDSIRKSGARGFTPDEQAALEAAIEGTPLQNVYRRLGAFSPDRAFGSITGAGAVGGGFAAGAGPLGLLVPAAGYVANKAAGNISANNVDDLINVIMNGGVKPPLNTAQQAVEDAYAPLIRAIIGAAESPDEMPAPRRNP
jgi:hypothetical protein